MGGGGEWGELKLPLRGPYVDNFKIVTGTHRETQGRQGTVSSGVENERRLLESLREMKVLLDLSPGLSTRFNVKITLTFVHGVNTFSEMTTGVNQQ